MKLKEIFNNILDSELKNGLDEKIYNQAKNKFSLKNNSIKLEYISFR